MVHLYFTNFNIFKGDAIHNDMTKEEIESVGFKWGDFDEVTARYNPETLKEGYNTMPDGEEVFYISNPALGLWAFKDRFDY